MKMPNRRFYQTFDLIHADTPQLREQANRLRY